MWYGSNVSNFWENLFAYSDELRERHNCDWSVKRVVLVMGVCLGWVLWIPAACLKTESLHFLGSHATRGSALWVMWYLQFVGVFKAVAHGSVYALLASGYRTVLPPQAHTHPEQQLAFSCPSSQVMMPHICNTWCPRLVCFTLPWVPIPPSWLCGVVRGAGSELYGGRWVAGWTGLGVLKLS